MRTALTAAVLRIHADRAVTAKREVRLLSRFTGANPHVPIVGVPSLPFDVSDLEALRAIADQITGRLKSVPHDSACVSGVVNGQRLTSRGQTALRCLRCAAKNSAQDTTSGCCLSRARR